MPPHIAALTLSTALVTSLAVAPAIAAENDDEITVIGEYLYTDKVNALKAPTPILDVPQSLSIFSAEEIAARGFTSIGQMADYTPGINSSQGEGHRDAIVFRGVRSTADFYIDGTRDDVQYYRPLYNLEQVEVLRGPNALLFGRGGTGGIINRVTKKAHIGEQFTGYQASVDTFGEAGVQIDTNFSTSDTSAFRINAMYDSLENHRDFYDGTQIGFNPTAKFELSPATTIDLSYEYADHERFIDRGIPTGADGEPVESLTDIVFADPEINETTLTAHLLRAVVQHTFSDTMKGRVTAFYGDYDKMYQNFYASGYDATANTVTLDGYVDTTERTSLILSGDLIGEVQTGAIGHTFLAGVEYIDTTNNNDRFNPVFTTSGNDKETFAISNPLTFSGGTGVLADGTSVTGYTFSSLNDKTDADVSVLSVYVQDQIEVSQYLDIILGARFDSFDQDVDVFDAAGDFTTRTAKDEEVSPRLGLVVKPQENVSLYASYSESFLPRSGGQYASVPSNPLDPDVFEQSEIGVKWDFADGLSLTVAFFQNDQTRAEDDGTGEQNEVRGLEVEGFEVQLDGQLTDRLYINAGYSNLSGETDEGAEIPRELPETTFSFWGAYQATDKFGLGVGATYQDESYISDFDIGISDDATHPTLPSFTRIDVAAYYDVREDLRVQLNIENLTDETYFPNAHSTHQATVGAPLNARLAVTGRF